MRLTDEEKRIFSGEQSPGMQRAIDLLIRLGDSFDAERLVPISYAHVSYDYCPEAFWNLMTEGVSKTEHRVTTHPSYQPRTWKKWGLPLADNWVDEHERKLETFKRLGWLRTETCAEYLLGIFPRKGEIVPMAGSCMQVANNSLFGARVDRMGTMVSLATAVCGRTPYMGLLKPENRFARHVVHVEKMNFSDWTSAHFHCLGYHIGAVIPGFKPVAVTGLPERLYFDSARALVISMPTSGAVTLAHVVGTTPEAPDLEAATGGLKPVNEIKVGVSELIRTWESLNVWDDSIVDHVAFGCPHATIDEIGMIASMLEGKKLKSTMLIGASIPVEALAKRQGYGEIIEKAGGRFLPVCPSIRNPFARRDVAGEMQAASCATNSARSAHYLATVCGTKVFFGTLEDCVKAAINGRWEGRLPEW